MFRSRQFHQGALAAVAMILGATLLSTPGFSAVEAGARATAEADAAARAELAERMEERALRTAASARTRATTRLEAQARKVNQAAASKTEAQMAGRLAAEFGTTPQAVLEEKVVTGASWGELMIAHSLAADARGDGEATAVNLAMLHEAGMGWGAIAAGLGLSLGQAVRAAQANVAATLAPSAAIDGAASVSTGAAVGAAGAGVSSSVGAGVGLGLGIGR